MPVMEPDLDAATLQAWARLISPDVHVGAVTVP